MSTETQSASGLLHRKSAALRWREFCEQWRHSYLLVAAVFFLIWRASSLAISNLENIRFMGGLHPLDVLLLKEFLKLMWVPPLVAIALYAASLAVPKLNTSAAVAVSALSSVILIAFILLCTLMYVSLWSV